MDVYTTQLRAKTMSVEPQERIIKRVNNLPRRIGGTFDHDNRNLKVSSSQQFGIRGGSTGILGDEDGYFFSFQQSLFIVDREGTTSKDESGMGWQGIGIWLVDRSDDVMVLHSLGESNERQSAHREKYVPGRFAYCESGRIGIRNSDPLIAGGSAPSRAGKPEPRYIKTATGLKGVSGHDRGKRVGCVDNCADFFVRNVAAKPINAAKSANSVRNRRQSGLFGAACQRNDCADTRFFGKVVSKRGCFGSASKDQQTVRVLYHRQFFSSHLCVTQ